MALRGEIGMTNPFRYGFLLRQGDRGKSGKIDGR